MHPLTTTQQEYTDALNATLITYNGNEQMLQNDMGNTKIQDSKTGNIMGLREGCIPVGMKEHGGIMYIASVDKDGNGEIGTIPSPVIRFNKDKKFITGEDRKNESKYKEFTIEKGFNESELYQLTDEKLSVGEKFAVALDIDDLIIEKLCRLYKDENWAINNLIYPLVSKINGFSYGESSSFTTYSSYNDINFILTSTSNYVKVYKLNNQALQPGDYKVSLGKTVTADVASDPYNDICIIVSTQAPNIQNDITTDRFAADTTSIHNVGDTFTIPNSNYNIYLACANTEYVQYELNNHNNEIWKTPSEVSSDVTFNITNIVIQILVENDSRGPKGLYKINLYSKTQDQVYNISNIIQSPYKYVLTNNTESSDNWFYNTIDGDKNAAEISFDIDTMLAEDLVDPGTTTIENEDGEKIEIENPKSFIKYPNIPDGYPCISAAKEGIKSVQLSTNESTGLIHPITLRDGNKYIIEFPELWYETDSAVHVDYFKVRVKDGNENKVTLKSENAETSEGPELTFKNGIKRFLDGKFKLISRNNSVPGTWYSGMDGDTTHINNLQSTNLYKSQVLFYIDEIENLNQWFTLEVDCYDNNFENEDLNSDSDPIYTYSLRFNLYLMDVLNKFTLLKVEPERDYPGVENGEWFSLYYNHGSNPNINLSDTHNFTLTSTIDCKNGLITLSDLNKLSKSDKYKNWKNDTSYLYTELVINPTISRTITNNSNELIKQLFTYETSVLLDNSLHGVINQSNLTSILFEVSYRVQDNTRQMLLSIGSTDLTNSLDQNDQGLFDITTRLHVTNSDLFYSLSDDVYMDISKINDYIYLKIADLKNFENKYQNLENIEDIELINISIAKFEIKFQMIDDDRPYDITRLYRWDPRYFSNNTNTYTINHSLSYNINIDEFENKSKYQIIPQFNLYGSDSIDAEYIPYGIMLYSVKDPQGSENLIQITEVVPCNLYTNINYLSTNSGYYIGYLMRRFLETSLSLSKYPIYEIAQDAPNVVQPSRYIPAGLYYLYVNFITTPTSKAPTKFTFKENSSGKEVKVEFPLTGSESCVVAFPTDGTLTQIEMGTLDLYSSMGMYRVNLDLDTTASKAAKDEYNKKTELMCWNNDHTNSENEQGPESRNQYAVPQAVFNYKEEDLEVLSTTYDAKFTPVHGYLKNFKSWKWSTEHNKKIDFMIGDYKLEDIKYRTS